MPAAVELPGSAQRRWRWKKRQAESAQERRRLELKVAELRSRKGRLDEAFIHTRAIDSPTYERQRDKLAEDAALMEMALNAARIDELDVESVQAFAEHLLLNVARMWTEASLDQKQRLQSVLFPAGVTYGVEGLGTAKTSLIFETLNLISEPKTGEVSLTVPSLNQILVWLREMDSLRRAEAA